MGEGNKRIEKTRIEGIREPAVMANISEKIEEARLGWFRTCREKDTGRCSNKNMELSGNRKPFLGGAMFYIKTKKYRARPESMENENSMHQPQNNGSPKKKKRRK